MSQKCQNPVNEMNDAKFRYPVLADLLFARQHCGGPCWYACKRRGVEFAQGDEEACAWVGSGWGVQGEL